MTDYTMTATQQQARERKLLEQSVEKWRRQCRLVEQRLADSESRRVRAENQLAGGTAGDAAALRALLAEVRADLERAEGRRKTAQAQADEYGSALDEVGDYLLKLGVPVPIEGYRKAAVRLVGDIMSLLNAAKPVESPAGEDEP